MKKAIFLISILIVSILISIPKTKSINYEKRYPSSYLYYFVGWNGGIKLFANDDECAYCKITNGIIDVYDFGFNFNETDIIDSVFVETEFYASKYSIDGDSVFNFQICLYSIQYHGGGAGNSSVFRTLFVEMYLITEFSYVDLTNSTYAFDITNMINGNQTWLNDIGFYLEPEYYPDLSPDEIYVDYVSVIVTWHTESSENVDVLIFFGVIGLCVSVCAVGLFAKKRR